MVIVACMSEEESYSVSDLMMDDNVRYRVTQEFPSPDDISNGDMIEGKVIGLKFPAMEGSINAPRDERDVDPSIAKVRVDDRPKVDTQRMEIHYLLRLADSVQTWMYVSPGGDADGYDSYLIDKLCSVEILDFEQE